MKNIIVRALSGAVYVALIVCSILFGGSWAFPALCCVFTFIGIMEFQRMAQSDFFSAPLTVLVDLIIGICLPVLVAAVYNGLFIIASVAMLVVLVTVMVRLVMQLYSHLPNPTARIATSFMSITYVAVPLAFATCLQCMSASLLLLTFVMIWLNDTGAFLVGSAIGSHRLFERLSPKKSWEGFVGGLAFCILAGYLAKLLVPNYFMIFSTSMLVGLGVLVSLFSTWGDLFESMIKRNAGVKDSGNIIPGHGGILDRIDSLLFVAPATVIYILIITFIQSTTILQGL